MLLPWANRLDSDSLRLVALHLYFHFHALAAVYDPSQPIEASVRALRADGPRAALPRVCVCLVVHDLDLPGTRYELGQAFRCTQYQQALVPAPDLLGCAWRSPLDPDDAVRSAPPLHALNVRVAVSERFQRSAVAHVGQQYAAPGPVVVVALPAVVNLAGAAAPPVCAQSRHDVSAHLPVAGAGDRLVVLGPGHAAELLAGLAAEADVAVRLAGAVASVGALALGNAVELAVVAAAETQLAAVYRHFAAAPVAPAHVPVNIDRGHRLAFFCYIRPHAQLAEI